MAQRFSAVLNYTDVRTQSAYTRYRRYRYSLWISLVNKLQAGGEERKKDKNKPYEKERDNDKENDKDKEKQER